MAQDRTESAKNVSWSGNRHTILLFPMKLPKPVPRIVTKPPCVGSCSHSKHDKKQGRWFDQERLSGNRTGESAYRWQSRVDDRDCVRNVERRTGLASGLEHQRVVRAHTCAFTKAEAKLKRTLNRGARVGVPTGMTKRSTVCVFENGSTGTATFAGDETHEVW